MIMGEDMPQSVGLGFTTQNMTERITIADGAGTRAGARAAAIIASLSETTALMAAPGMTRGCSTVEQDHPVGRSGQPAGIVEAPAWPAAQRSFLRHRKRNGSRWQQHLHVRNLHST